MYRVTEDLKISIHGWDNSTFKKGDIITNEKLGARLVKKGKAELIRSAENNEPEQQPAKKRKPKKPSKKLSPSFLKLDNYSAGDC